MRSKYTMVFIQRYSRLLQVHHKETLRTNPPIYIYINRISNRLVLKIKDEYNLELQMPEITKLLDNTKKLTDKLKMVKMYRVLNWLK